MVCLSFKSIPGEEGIGKKKKVNGTMANRNDRCAVALPDKIHAR
jgi:hypothetical protein